MKKILVIDDDRDMAETIETLLSGFYQVSVETDHANINAHFGEFLPDLIILDNEVGQKRALKILEELRPHTAFNTTSVVLFSGHPDISILATQVKADAWLAKPFVLNDLYTCVNKLLN